MRKQCRVKKSTKNNFDSILLIICSMQSSCVWRLVQLPHKMQTTSAHARIEGNKKKKIAQNRWQRPWKFCVIVSSHTIFCSSVSSSLAFSSLFFLHWNVSTATAQSSRFDQTNSMCPRDVGFDFFHSSFLAAHLVSPHSLHILQLILSLCQLVIRFGAEEKTFSSVENARRCSHWTALVSTLSAFLTLFASNRVDETHRMRETKSFELFRFAFEYKFAVNFCRLLFLFFCCCRFASPRLCLSGVAHST